MRWTGLILLCVGVAGLGLYRAGRYKSGARLYKELSEYFAFVGEKALTGQMSIVRINQLAASVFPRLTFLKTPEGTSEDETPYDEDWVSAVSAAPELLWADSESVAQIKDFSRWFRQSCLTDFTGECRRLEARFALMYRKENEKNSVRCRESVLFGVLGAGALFLALM